MSVNSYRYSAGEVDGELVECLGPVLDRVGPFLLGVAEGEPQQFEGGVVGREVATVLDDLAQLAVDGFDRVRRVDDPTDRFGEGEERDEPFPVASPQLAD